MDAVAGALRTAFGENRIKEQELMAHHTALKVGGPATLYIELDTTADLIKVLKLAHEHSVKFVVIGAGSKTIFSDSGFDGLVIKNNTRKFDVLSRKGKIRNNKIDVDRAYIYAESGAIVNQVVRFTIEQGYSGLEQLLGISGTIGGRLFTTSDKDEEQSSLDQHLYQIQAVSFDGHVQQVTKSDLLYTDRKGKLQKGKYAALSVIFELFPGDTKTLWAKGTQIIEKRNEEKPESPLAFRAFADITLSEAMSIPTPEYSQSVAYLIEQAGLTKLQVGDVRIVPEYPSYIQNGGNATGNDMIKLITEVKKALHSKYGVVIRETVQIIE